MQKINEKKIKIYSWSFYDGEKSISGKFVRVGDLPSKKKLENIVKIAIKGYNNQFPTLNSDTLTLSEYITKSIYTHLTN